MPEKSVPPVVFALLFFNKAYFAKTALNYSIRLAFGTINNENVTKKMQNSETGAPKAWDWTDAVAWDR